MGVPPIGPPTESIWQDIALLTATLVVIPLYFPRLCFGLVPAHLQITEADAKRLVRIVAFGVQLVATTVAWRLDTPGLGQTFVVAHVLGVAMVGCWRFGFWLSSTREEDI